MAARAQWTSQVDDLDPLDMPPGRASALGTPLDGTPQPTPYSERMSIAQLDKPWKNPDFKRKGNSKTLKQVLMMERDRTLPVEERIKRKKKKAAGRGIKAAAAEAAAMAEEEAIEEGAQGAPTVTCAPLHGSASDHADRSYRLHHRGASLDQAGEALLRYHRSRSACARSIAYKQALMTCAGALY